MRPIQTPISQSGFASGASVTRVSDYCSEIQAFPQQEVLLGLHTTRDGLDEAEAKRRLTEYGPNCIPRAASTPAILKLLREFTRFFSLILWAAAGLAFYAEYRAPGEGMVQIGYALIVVIVVSGCFSFWQESRAERSLAALLKLLPDLTKTLRQGLVRLVPVEELVPGDVIVLQQGDKVPADCRLIEAFDVLASNATITGEAVPVPKSTQASTSANVVECENILLAGTCLLSGDATAVIFATGARTEFGKIAQLTQSRSRVTSPLRKDIARLSRTIAVLAIAIGLVFFGVAYFLGVPFWKDFMFAIGIVVAMVPEGLLPTLTLALVLAARRMAKRNVLIRQLPCVETLGCTTVVCTDKTGTLTENRMTVRCLFTGESLISTDDTLKFPEKLARDCEQFFLAARHCHTLKRTKFEDRVALRSDAMEASLIALVDRVAPELPSWGRIDEVPFDSDRMRLSTIHDTPGGPRLYCKGAPEKILEICNRRLCAGHVIDMDVGSKEAAEQAQHRMAENGLRVLGLAYADLTAPYQRSTVEQNLIFLGLTGFEDPPRAEVPDAIRRCQVAGVKVIMVTGDHPETAVSIGRQIGLLDCEHPVVITGKELNAMSDVQLQLHLDSTGLLFARVSAAQKMRLVDILRRKGHIVAVTGDGVNDGPALKTAHIGIAMGLSGTDVAREAADMVLMDDNFASIVAAIEEGRTIFENIRKFLVYVLVHNVAELLPYLAFVLFPVPLALTPIQALAIDMGTDSLTALGLGVEKPEPNTMERPPRPIRESLLNRSTAARAYLFLGPIEAVSALTVFFLVLGQFGWCYGQSVAPSSLEYRAATAACLSTIVMLQIVNVFLCRSAIMPVSSQNICTNRLILIGVLSEIVMIALFDYSNLGQQLLGTAALPGRVWVLMLPFAGAMLILDEIRKRFVEKAHK